MSQGERLCRDRLTDRQFEKKQNKNKQTQSRYKAEFRIHFGLLRLGWTRTGKCNPSVSTARRDIVLLYLYDVYYIGPPFFAESKPGNPFHRDILNFRELIATTHLCVT